jgi:hypothetical protein
MCDAYNAPMSEDSGHPQNWGTTHLQNTERAVIGGHATTGRPNAFRAANRLRTTALSRRASKSVARHYDPVFASPELTPIKASFGDLGETRFRGISDHSPLRAVFRVTDTGGVKAGL